MGEAMNSFMVGSLIILYFLVSQAAAAYIQTQTTSDFQVGDCETIIVDGNNQTTCQGVDGPSFIETVLEVSTTGIDGAWDVFNQFWIGIHAIILAIGISLIIGWLFGLLFGGAN